MLQTGLQLQQISATNKLPNACNRLEATRQKAVRVSPRDHDSIMEEAGKRELEYDVEEDSEDEELESELESESDSESASK